jgi:hypothetical protein
MSFATLPDQILHLIHTYITPGQPAFDDDEKYQSPPLYHTIVNFSIFAPFLNRIFSAQITLIDCCTRWDLIPRTVMMGLEKEALDEKKMEEGLMGTREVAEHTFDEKMAPTSDDLTLQEAHNVNGVEVTAQEQEVDIINEFVDIVDEEKDEHDEEEEEEEEEEEDSDWSERNYEDDSEDSDWDSENDSDYEDDWEAEYGFSLPKTESAKEIPVPSNGVLVPGRSLLDF